MGYYATKGWGRKEIEPMIKSWHIALRNAKTPAEKKEARDRISQLQEAWRSSPPSDSRRRAPRRTGLLGLNFGKSVRFG